TGALARARTARCRRPGVVSAGTPQQAARRVPHGTPRPPTSPELCLGRSICGHVMCVRRGPRLQIRGRPGGVLISVSTRRRGQARSTHAVAGGITALSPHSEILEALVRASPVAIIALDRQGRVQLWNPAAERLFGWAASDVTGRPYPLVPADRRDEY